MTHSPPPDNWQDRWQDLIAGYALGNLDAEEAEALQQLLAEHPELSTEVDQLQETLGLMPYSLEVPEPPESLRSAILSQAQVKDRLVGIFQKEQSRRRLAGTWKAWGGAIAALLIGALAFDNYRLYQVAQTYQSQIAQLSQEAATNQALATALKQPDAKLYTLAGTDKAAQASASLVVVPGDKQVVIVVNNLPQLPAGKAYRLWAMAANATQPTYCGEFNVQQAISSWAAPEAVCGQSASQMLVTAERVSDPPIPKGELVMKSRV